MYNSIEKINQVRSFFNLNLYEAKLWLALMSKKEASTGELSLLTNVPRSRIYDVLRSLERKGFIISKQGKPIKFEVLDLDKIIDNFYYYLQSSLKERKNLLEKFKETELYSELKELYKEEEQTKDDLIVLKGKSNINNMISYLLSKAKKHVMFSFDEKGLYERINHFRDEIKNVSKNGVKIGIIANVSSITDTFVADLLKQSNVKLTSKETLGKFVLVDDKLLLILNESSPIYSVAVLLDSNEFIDFLKDELKKYLP